MDDKTRLMLANSYKNLELAFYEVQESWSEGDLTTAAAIEQQKQLRERMKEIRELLNEDIQSDYE